MKAYYSIAIPKPCHEDWHQMTPKEKGKFCNSCSKTVIDFTKMNTHEIQDFIHKNKNNRICGHFKQTQLDSINLHIPSKVLEQRLNFHKLFLLALLITMGTTLMNCTNKNGNSQKIDSIEVIDSLNNNKVVNVLEGLPLIEKMDSIPKPACNSSKNKSSKHNSEAIILDGLMITTVGNIESTCEAQEAKILDIDSIKVPEPPEIMGDLMVEPEIEGEIILGMLIVEHPPEFKDTPKNLSIQEKRDYLSKGISKIIKKNFNTSVCLDLKGRQKIYMQFQIDTTGHIQNIRVRAPHPLLEKEAIRTLKLLPQFIPAKQNNQPITTVYTLPIIFEAEQ